MNLNQFHDLYHFNINTCHLLQQNPFKQIKNHFVLRNKKGIKREKLCVYF